MQYWIYKLNFNSPVHFGRSDSALSLESSSDHFLADTLFSALCIEALKEDKELFKSLVNKVDNDQILLTDSMIWHNDQFYIPKPYIISSSDREVDISKRKQIKNLTWIPIDSIDSFADSVKGKEDLNLEDFEFENNEKEGEFYQITKINRIRDIKDPDPFNVGAFFFSDNSGLYFIAGLENSEDKEFLDSLVKSLSFSGIGGKVTSGFGKFDFKTIEISENSNSPALKQLYKDLSSNEASRYLLLTTSIPNDNELDDVLEDAYYNLQRRSGFIQSDSFSKEPVKKDTQYYFSSGSTFKRKFDGQLYDVGENGPHPVYRYSKPLFLGVEL